MGAIVLLPLCVDDAALDRCLAALDAAPRRAPRSGWPMTRRQGRVRRPWSSTGWRIRRCRPSTPGARGRWARLPIWMRCCAPAMAGRGRAGAGQRAVARLVAAVAGCLRPRCRHRHRDPWCNAGETAAWPRLGEINPEPHDPALLAHTCATLPTLHQVAIGGHPRGAGTWQRAPPCRWLDVDSYAGWNAALIDLSLRMAGLGWRNVLCETAFVSRAGEAVSRDGDTEARRHAGRPGCRGWPIS